MKNILLRFFIMLFCISNAYAKNAQVNGKFIPLTLECTIFSNEFSGVKNGTIENLKATLAGPNSSKEGHRLVSKLGNYEFWVVVGETLNDPKRTEIYSYNAEIRDTSTNIVSQAKSSDSVVEPSKKAIKISKIALVKYDSNPSGKNHLLESSQLSMSCMHFPSKNKEEALILTH